MDAAPQATDSLGAKQEASLALDLVGLEIKIHQQVTDNPAQLEPIMAL